jgi:hypothetical protein
MSERNGDKARFQRLRKAGVKRRQRAREVWAAIQQRAAARIQPEPDREQSGGVRGPLGMPHLMTGEPVTD